MLVKSQPGHAIGGINSDRTINLPAKLRRNPAEQGVSLSFVFQSYECQPCIPSGDAIVIYVMVCLGCASTVKERIPPIHKQQRYGSTNVNSNPFCRFVISKRFGLSCQIERKGFTNISRKWCVTRLWQNAPTARTTLRS